MRVDTVLRLLKKSKKGLPLKEITRIILNSPAKANKIKISNCLQGLRRHDLVFCNRVSRPYIWWA